MSSLPELTSVQLIKAINKGYEIKEYKDYEVGGQNIEQRVWLLNGNIHREDGLPAIEYNDGTKEWWVNDSRHREDGPAIVHSNGTRSWWLNDVPMTEEEFKKQMNNKRLSNAS